MGSYPSKKHLRGLYSALFALFWADFWSAKTDAETEAIDCDSSCSTCDAKEVRVLISDGETKLVDTVLLIVGVTEPE